MNDALNPVSLQSASLVITSYVKVVQTQGEDIGIESLLLNGVADRAHTHHSGVGSFVRMCLFAHNSLQLHSACVSLPTERRC